MDRQDETPDRSDHRRTPAATRRRVLSVAALGGTLAAVDGVRGSAVQANERIELDGRAAGWVGRSPADVEGETNPTLTLTAGETYRIVWENVDGAPHNVVIEDGEGTQLVRSDILSEQGATQTVEFTASEAMAEYFCQVHPNTMRGDLSIEVGQTEDLAEERPEDDGEREEPERPAFEPPVVEEQQGDVATFTVSLGGDDQVDVVVGSRELNYAVAFTVVDGESEPEEGESGAVDDAIGGGDASGETDRAEGNDTVTTDGEPSNETEEGENGPGESDKDEGADTGGSVGDGEVTVAFDTFVAGRSDEPEVSAVAEEDEIRNYERLTPTLQSPLEPAAYPLEAYVDGDIVATGGLILRSRETVGANPGVAPRQADPSQPADFRDVVTPRDRVARGDWEAVEVRATGLYATLGDVAAFEDESLGYELTIERTDVPNRRDTLSLDEVTIVTDAENDRFLAVVDTASLPVDATYEATFAVTDANPYVPDGERESAATAFTVVDRSASFDAEGGELRVPPIETELSGTATVAPGTPLTVRVASAEEVHLRETVRTAVDEDGAWSVTVDFSGYVPGMTFVATVIELDETAEGEVVTAE